MSNALLNSLESMVEQDIDRGTDVWYTDQLPKPGDKHFGFIVESMWQGKNYPIARARKGRDIVRFHIVPAATKPLTAKPLALLDETPSDEKISRGVQAHLVSMHKPLRELLPEDPEMFKDTWAGVCSLIFQRVPNTCAWGKSVRVMAIAAKDLQSNNEIFEAATMIFLGMSQWRGEEARIVKTRLVRWCA